MCSGHRELAGIYDLKTLNSELAKQWHPIKNGGLLPNMILLGSEKVRWICQNGYEWEAYVNSRAMGGGCPKMS
ncbi:zinc-ribbon domain-containing protein [Ruminococcus flavefaciens]|uniref:zinc-ribbon domain-containing protein n=1 Tax=Ruminococcus flavefaciens TaxID=1265 RepID=UPI000D6D3A89